MTKYMHGEKVHDKIISVGLDLWREKGAQAVSARGIGKVMGLTHNGVRHHFEDVADMKRQIADEAIRQGDTTIIPQLIVNNDPAVAHFTPEQRTTWLNAARV